MALIKKIKNTFTKGKFKDNVTYTGTDPKAIKELVYNLNKFNEKLYGYNSIGGRAINFDEKKLDTKEFYEKCYIHRGLKNEQIDELFKHHIINDVVNKGGIFSGFRNWSKDIHSKLKSIVSKSRSQIEKVEKIADTDRKKHWEKFFDIGIATYDKLQKVFDPENFNKKFVKNGNKKSRLASKDVTDAINEIAKKMKAFSNDYRECKEKLDDLTLDDGNISLSTNDKFKGNNEKAVEYLANALGAFNNKLNNSYASGVETFSPPNEHNYNNVKRGPKSLWIEEIFKTTVIKGVIDRGSKFGEFRKWSDGIYSQLKSITSKAHSKIAKIEKIAYTDHQEHWKKFYEIELEALKKVGSIFYPYNAFNQKFFKNKKSRLYDPQIEEALESLINTINCTINQLKHPLRPPTIIESALPAYPEPVSPFVE